MSEGPKVFLPVSYPVPGSMLPGHAHVEDSGKVRLCAAYVGADCETVDGAQVGQQIGYDQGVSLATAPDGKAPNPISWEREQTLRRAQNVLLDAANARIAALESKLAVAYQSVAALEAENGCLRTDRTYLLYEIAKLRLGDFASRAEGELVDRVEAGDRSFPMNALRHSR